MAGNNELLVGQIALEKGLITRDQLEAAVAEQAKISSPLGVVLVSMGLLTEGQFLEVLEEHRRRMEQPSEYAEVRREDLLFGKRLVREGRAREEVVNEALRRQQEDADRGTVRRLGEILVDSGAITADDVREMLRSQGKTLLECSGCGARFNVVGYVGGRLYECRSCGNALEAAGGAVRADETAVTLPVVQEPAAGDPKKTFGKYVLLRQVGSGGFGVVYKAWQKDLRRVVALKLLQADDAQSVKRFLREAQISAKLTHPNIVPVYEVGEQDGKPFIAMEFVEGTTLKSLRVEPRRALELIRDVAGAVQYAHEKGTIHRDLKPQNLMLGEDGHVRVMDFGLARQSGGGTTLTVAGEVVGTPSYMPPEQAAGLRCDERSDVYSLGATLYELLTGRPPFDAPTPLEVLDRIRTDDPVPPRRHDARIHPEAETIVLKALEKDAARRYASAREFANDIRRHLEGEPILARPAGWIPRLGKWARRHRAVTAASAAALLMACAGAGAWLFAAARQRDRIADRLARAGKAKREGRFAEARNLYAEVKTLAPGHPEAEPGFYEMDRAAREAERLAANRREGAEFALAGRRARIAYEALEGELRRLREEEQRLAKEIAPSDGEARKSPLWTLQRRIEEVRRQRADQRAAMLAAYTRAVGVDPGQEEAKDALAEYYWAEYLTAERDDPERASELRQYVELYDRDGRYREAFDAGGTLEIESDPPGAEVRLFRFEEGPDRRLLARPCESGRLLPRGSYLAILRRSGFRDVRYPVVVGRGTAHRARVRLYTEAEISEECVYVPAGTFLFGGDREAYQGAPLDATASTGDYFIGRFEVTIGDYAGFLEALLRVGREEEARKWAPRGGLPADPRVQRVAVHSITWEAAEAYCRWRTETAGDKAVYRLPTMYEWEKAARGVDGRRFPWGDQFDFSFTHGGPSRPGGPGFERVGQFPKDESPYGVRDLAGGMKEWCADGWYPGRRDVRGGWWSCSEVSRFHAAARWWEAPGSHSNHYGFRFVRELRR